jgi:hypothetical protein
MSRHKTSLGSRWSIYWEPRDLWIGAFVGERAFYLCLIPTIIVRVRRGLP